MSRRLAQGFTPVAPGMTAVVALGANLGDRHATLAAAVDALRALPLVQSVVVSTAIESVAVKPDGLDASAPAYLNAVATMQTRMAPSVLLRALHAIEADHGRERRERWGDRTLDLDLVAWADVISTECSVQVPHPRAAERDFVLAPWHEIDPTAYLAGHGAIADVLQRLRAEVAEAVR